MRSVGAIAQLDVQAWVNKLAAKELSASTVRQSYQLFDRVMRAAVLGPHSRVPVSGHTPPAGRAPRDALPDGRASARSRRRPR
jgi:hypothetical protein